MSAFTEACEVETIAMRDVVPFIASHSQRFVLTNKGRMSEEIQKRYGDAIAETDKGIHTIELKAERENKHGNLFLETWSNRRWFTLGWMFKVSGVDILLYYFLTERYMISVSLPKLRKWAFHEQRIYSFPERCQNKYSQMNDTWGRCVPIEVIRNEVGIREYKFEGKPGQYQRL